MRRLKKQENH